MRGSSAMSSRQATVGSRWRRASMTSSRAESGTEVCGCQSRKISRRLRSGRLTRRRSSVISSRLDQSFSGFVGSWVWARNQSETACDPARGRGALIASSFLRSAVNPSCQDLWNGMKLRSDSIQPSSLGFNPSRFSGIRKSRFLSRPSTRAKVRSLTGFVFEMELCERTPRTRKVRCLIARSMSRGYDSPPSSWKRSHHTA